MMRRLIRQAAQTLALALCAAAAGLPCSKAASQADPQPLFTEEEVRAYVPKGPSQRYRYFCSAYQCVHDGPPESYLTRADPVEYAEFHEELHADAALILAVPHEGYCTYPSEIGPVYPSCAKRDFLGQTIRELHKRDISAFAYVTLGWNPRYVREHPEFSDGDTICFCSPYMDLIIAYSEEVLRKYPVDGLRWDILWQSARCRCDGCRKLYREMFSEEMPETWGPEQQRKRMQFREEKVAQAVRRLHAACKAVKPSVEIWQNHLNVDHDSPLSAMDYVDMAYIEWGDPWGLLFHNSATPKKGFIVGKLENLGFRTMRQCLALGGHGYTYIMARHDTALPPASEEEAEQWRRQRGWTSGGARENARSRAETIERLAPFYEMLAASQQFYEDGQPVYHGVGVVFCDATRYRRPDFSRAAYTKLLRTLGDAYLKRSLALEYLSSHMLPGRDLRSCPALVLMETSGLRAGELDALRAYVHNGGNLLVVGDALRHDEHGDPLSDFALAQEMGVHFSEAADPLEDSGPWRWACQSEDGERATLEVDRAGETTLSLWPRETGYRVDRIVLARAIDFTPTPAELGTHANSPHIVFIEAEAFSENTPRNGAEWQVGAAQQPGFSGTGYVGTPGGLAGFVGVTDYEARAPELRYRITIPEAGRWFVWVRQNSTRADGDSVYLGLQGKGRTDVNFDAGRELQPPEGSGAEILADDRSPLHPSRSIVVNQAVATTATAGTTLLRLKRGDGAVPLLHENLVGKGRVWYMASTGSLQLLQDAIDALAGPGPVAVTPEGRQVVLTRQEKRGRWILHILDDGDCSVEIDRAYAQPEVVAGLYPEDGWSATMDRTDAGVRITAKGAATNRLVVLE